MSGKQFILDFSEFDLDHVIADLDEIRRLNPQRFEMEQLTAIVYEDIERKVCAGYKDIGHHEFWARGHMPGAPLMPGVMMCEAAAQLCSYFAQKYEMLGAEMLGFGGLEDVRFRDIVLPGNRLVIVTQLVKVRPRAMIISRFECFVRQTLVCEGTIKGIPLPTDLLKTGSLRAER